MSFPVELAVLFRRDLTRLGQQIRAFPDQDTLWRTLPGVSNSAGNLALHLEGNLREYVARQLGGVPYQRHRSLEFSQNGVAVEELAARVDVLCKLIPGVIEQLSPADLDAPNPEVVLGMPLTTRQFLLHLLGHFNYHLGQIDYLRRGLTASGAITLVGLS